MKLLFRVLLVVTAAALPNVCNAQCFDDYRKQAEEEYNSYKKQANDDYESFRKRANEEYSDFMRQSWAFFKGERAIPVPEDDELPPIVCPDIDLDELEDNEIPFIDTIPYDFDDEPLAPIPIPTPVKPAPLPEQPSMKVSFYGTDTFVHFDPRKRQYLRSAREQAAADMWKAMNTDDFASLVADCMGVKQELNLCDWAYQLYLDRVCDDIYGKSNEAVMLKAFILCQSGYKIRLGRDDEDILHLLVSLSDDIVGYAYFDLGDSHYYLTDGSEVKSLYIFNKAFPEEKSIRMSLGRPVTLTYNPSARIVRQSENYPSARVAMTINKNLMAFFSDYPQPVKRNVDYSVWSFYANTPFSDEVRKEIYPALKSSIAGKSQPEAANILINFVQTAFEYKKDNEQWGYERPFFPEETLYYKYSDCEDRAILFTRLVRDLMGLDAVLLYYPGHLASAVKFTEPVKGDFLNIQGEKYIVCDPTYIHAPIGLTMPDMDNSKAVVVLLD